MKTTDAKFLLRALRPDGRDLADPLFAEALAQARQDPGLSAWLAREQATDATIAASLATLAPPAGLRDAILVGARASTARPRRVWWQQPGWLAAAACLALAATLVVVRRPSAPVGNAFALAALHDLRDHESAHPGHTPGLAALDARLASVAAPVPAALAGLDLAQLKAGGCRTLAVNGHEVFELCFERDGKWFHLYVARRADFPSDAPSAPVFASEAKLATAAWADATHLYALVTDAGSDALRQVL
jgi:hypothetical protein